MSDCAHEHEWLRFPVVDFSVHYGCPLCSESRAVFAPLGTSWEDMDAFAEQQLGGRVVGEVPSGLDDSVRKFLKGIYAALGVDGE